MGNSRKISVFLALFVSFPGFYFSYQSLNWLYNYYKDTGSSVRHEYLIGVFWYALFALGCWIIVSLCTLFFGKEIPKAVLLTINIPLIITALALIYWIVTGGISAVF